MSSSDQHFSSRLGLILSVLGIAVGTGNIWRFPRIAAQNSGEAGAGAFLVAWFIFLLAWSVPLIIAEYALGRKGRMGVVGTISKIAGEKFAWMGAFIAFVSTAIMFYYSVVTGWSIYYFTRMISNPLPLSTESSQAIWDAFQGGGGPVIFHAVAMGIGAFVVLKGVSSIERVNKILIPTLFVIVLISVVRAITLDGASDGISFLFTPDWATLKSPKVWIEALTQNAWDTGAGFGLILTYGAYMKSKHGVVKNSFITGFGNNTVSLLAALMIFGTVFATLGAEMSKPEILEVMRTSGPAATGLTFIWMPQLFAKMQFGGTLATLFFLGLSFAAFSSLIAMIELASRTFVDLGLSRKTAVTSVGILGFSLGVPSAVNLTIFENQDFVWGVALIISGAFAAYSIIRYGASAFRKEAIDSIEDDWNAGKTWDVIIKYVVPIEAAILLVWFMWVSATEYAPDSWFNPLEPLSVMTALVQWSIVAVAFMLLNKKLNQRMFSPLS
ncbi:MAG: sodium-dependent transporter [Rhodothermia bacterium]|nr:MAG: sodium-dependent transporter [Rhodothermia bacterium]